MRYALISDLHANLQAWQAVDTDIRNHGADQVICLGDVVGYGPDPAAVLDATYDRCDGVVVGNHDAVVAGMLDRELFNDNAKRLIDWTCNQLGDDAAAYFRGLPYKMASEQLLCVHAEAVAPARFGYVVDTATAAASFAASTEPIIFIGHTHVPGIFVQTPDGAVSWQAPTDLRLEPSCRYLVNVGSVGDPRDNSPRASYCLFDVDTGDLTFRRVAFSLSGYRTAIERAGLATTPHCLNLLKKGVSLSPSSSMRDMALDTSRAAEAAPVQASTHSVDLKSVHRPADAHKQKFSRSASARPQVLELAPPPSKRTGLWIACGLVATLVLGFAVMAIAFGSKPPAVAPAGSTVAAPTTPPPAAPAAPAPPSAADIKARAEEQAAVMARMTAAFEADRQRKALHVKDPIQSKIAGKTLDTTVGSAMTVEGELSFSDDDDRPSILLNGATLALPVAPGANAHDWGVTAWIKRETNTDGLILEAGSQQLTSVEGKLQLTVAETAYDTDVSTADLADWTHVCIRVIGTAYGSIQAGTYLHINGKRVVHATAADEICAPIRLPQFSGRVADLRLEPIRLSGAAVERDYKSATKAPAKASPPAPEPAPALAAMATAERDALSPIRKAFAGDNPLWLPSGNGFAAANYPDIRLSGPTSWVSAGEHGGFAACYPGSRAEIMLEPAPPRDNFTVACWYRPHSATDGAILAVGEITLLIVDQRLAVQYNGQRTKFDNLPITAGVWHRFFISKPIGDKAYVGTDNPAHPPIEIQLGKAKLPLEPLTYPALNGDLGAVQVFFSGLRGLTDATRSRLKSYHGARLDAATAPQRPPRVVSWLMNGAALKDLAASDMDGVVLKGGRGVERFTDVERQVALYLKGDGKGTVDLRLPQLPQNATGGSLGFLCKIADRPGQLLQLSGAAGTATVSTNGTDALIVRVGDEDQPPVPCEYRKWQRLAVTWDASSLCLYVNDRLEAVYPGTFPTAGSAVSFGASDAPSAVALIDDLRLAPYQIQPETISSQAP